MKLWKKLSLLCGAILILTVSSCTALLLRQAQEKILSLTYEQAESRQRNLARSFTEMADSYYFADDSEAVKHTVLNYCFSYLADASDVLVMDGQTLYSQVGIRPEQYLVPDANRPSPQRFTGVIDGRRILIAGSAEYTPYSQEKTCAVYVVEDITPVYEDIAGMLRSFALIGGFGILAGLSLIILIVRRSLRPLTRLQQSAARIASGHYNERTAVDSSDEVGLLAEDFNRMAESVERHIDELTEQIERQKLFIGSVTHEFKTPLTALLLNADILQNTYMEEEDRQKALARITQQCRWLERLVQKLLKLITVKQQAELTSVSVFGLLERVRDDTEETLRARGVRLNIRCEADTMELDADLMQSALVNLLDNASKASAPGQAVTLSAYGNILEVSDHGAGIQTEDQRHITEPFYMADKSRSKRYGGIGLGLALVKEIAAAHRAALEIESAPGEGTTVRIRLHP